MINDVGGVTAAFQTGVEGFQRASNGVSEAASNIATRSISSSAPQDNSSVAQPKTSLSDDIVALKVNERAAQASAQVIETANAAVGQLIDEIV